jgi:hypothetical protein
MIDDFSDAMSYAFSSMIKNIEFQEMYEKILREILSSFQITEPEISVKVKGTQVDVKMTMQLPIQWADIVVTIDTAQGSDLDKLAENFGLKRLPSSQPESSCEHEWTEYVGLKECFTYCKKCDQKHS